ncbi:MAG: sigma-70 family RNA polymerase sigma factor [Nocardioidaceae bacterium]|nr:sigma-70 family RNA polymerase sigma factor [Nocardioidaceae bacterium]
MTASSDVRRIGTDPDALETFYREHLPAVQRFVARRVDDPHTAADLVADTFLAAIGAASRFDPSSGSARGWIFGIARHTVLMEHRQRARRARAVDRAGGRRELQPDAIENATARIDAEQEARGLYRRLEALTPGPRAVFELVVLDQLSVAEAAAVLHIRPGAARVRLHRAQKALGLHTGSTTSLEANGRPSR